MISSSDNRMIITAAQTHNAFQWATQPPKIATSHAATLTHLIHSSWALQTASRLVQLFLHSTFE